MVDQSKIVRGVRLYHIPTKTVVALCNCASVAQHKKVSYAKAHPDQYTEVENAPKPA
jgi:hypothetical protein